MNYHAIFKYTSFALSQTLVSLFVVACLDFTLLNMQSREESSIMPNAKRVVKSDISGIYIQGGWYWYKNIKSTIKEFVAVVNTPKEEECEFEWYQSDTELPEESYTNLSRDCKNRVEQPVEKICIDGVLESDSEKDPTEGYISIGFELCTSSENSLGLYQFPYTLGTCPLRGNEAQEEQFIGVSFKVKPYKDEKKPRFETLIVQFKERGDQDTNQPYCVVSGEILDKSNKEHPKCVVPSDKDEDTETVEACIGESKTEIGEPVNPKMLQAVHFQAQLSERTDTTVSFCLTEIKAIVAKDREIAEEEKNTAWELIPIDTSGEERTERDTDTTGMEWIPARDEDAPDDYPDGGDFDILKSEVTVKQYLDYCHALDICDSVLRKWDSCNVYRYIKTKEGDLNAAANCINWWEAKNYCTWKGGELPNLLQWEYAATAGYLDYEYPWGNDKGDPSCERVVIYDFKKGGSGCGNNDMPDEVCSEERVGGKTETGVCDMLGNLWEWVSDDYLKVAGGSEAWLSGYKTIKGGAFNTESAYLGIYQSTSPEHPAEPHSPTRVGFRCIKYK